MNSEEILDVELFSQHYSALGSFLFLKCKDIELTKDLLQDTYIKAKISIDAGKYIDEGKLRSWLYRVANSTFIDYVRDKNKRNKFEGTPLWNGEKFNIWDTLADDNNVEDIIILKEELQQIIDAKVILSEAHKKTFERRISGMAFKDIASESDLSVNTVLGHFRYALINIRKVLNITPKKKKKLLISNNGSDVSKLKFN